MVAGLSADDFVLPSAAVRERECREAVGFGTLCEAAAPYRPSPPCPRCRSESARLDGRGHDGLQRLRRPACGRCCSSPTGTVLGHGKSDMPTRVQLVRPMRSNVPPDAIAEACGVSHQTAWEWRHRVFATAGGCRDGLVLRERVWVDEAYLVDADLAHGFGQARRRGLSRRQVCMAVAIGVHRNPVAVVCGHGKPSSERAGDGLASRMAEGSAVVGDKERAHNAPVRAVKGTHEAHKADIRDPVCLERVAMVNDLCSRIRRHLWRLTGMGIRNLRSYLNWHVYLFRVKQAKEGWPEIARVVRHLLMVDARFRSST